MNVWSLKLAGAAAGFLLLVGMAPNVFAQTAVLNATSCLAGRLEEHISTFTFTKSLILNAIGTPNTTSKTFSYKIGSSPEYTTVTGSGTQAGNFWYFTFANPQTYPAGTTVMIYSKSGSTWGTRNVSGTNAVGVTHTNTTSGRLSGNIKVSDPGSNVAPEPGSIALLLTGGGALAGIALRRRRNDA